MTETTNYKLSQWEADDRVQRVDFNADNAKIDAALHDLRSNGADLEKRMAFLERSLPKLSYYIGQLSLIDFMNRKRVIASQALFYDCFIADERFTLTGSAVITNNVLTLRGQGATGKMTTGNFSVLHKDWTQLRMWVRQNGDKGVTPKVNGQALTLKNVELLTNLAGKSSAEMEYVLENVKGTSNIQVTLDLACNSSSLVEVYDYILLFL